MLDPVTADHLAHLAASGITEKHAGLRGYQTVCAREQPVCSTARDDRIFLLGEGFTERQCGRVRQEPGLLIPLLDKRVDRWGWQLRNFMPDTGLDPQWAKYHSPLGQDMHLDVPPGAGEMLEDPEEPLWITEGSKKADCAFLHGLCCIALLGVWGWRGTNGYNGVTTLEDWEEVAFRNSRTRQARKVIIAFDGDIMRKEGVRQSTYRLARWLKWRGADPRILWLPDTKNKTGLDDFLMTKNTVADLWKLVRPFDPSSAFWFADKTKTNGEALKRPQWIAGRRITP